MNPIGQGISLPGKGSVKFHIFGKQVNQQLFFDGPQRLKPAGEN